MDIEVRNILGAARANFSVEPGQIALIAGLNYSGKSSLLEGVAACLTQVPFMRDVGNKKDLPELVREGRKEGHITVSTATGSATLKLPTGEVSGKGDMPEASPYATGVRHVGAMSSAARQEYLTAALGALPTQEDLAQYFIDKKVQVKEATLESVWRLILDQGWKPAEKKIHDTATATRGKWEQVSGENYGKKKADGWVPKDFDWDEDLNYQRLSEEAQTALEDAIATQAVSNEKMAELRAVMEAGKTANERIGDLQKTTEDAAKAHENAVRALDRLPRPVDTNHMDCPHCGEAVVVISENAYTTKLVKADVERIGEDELRKRRLDIVSAEAKVKHAKEKLDTANQQVDDAQRQINRAVEAKEVHDAGLDKDGDTDIADIARQKRDAAQAELTHFNNMVAAGRLHKTYTTNMAVLDAVKPTGLRATKLKEKLDAFNIRLVELCRMFGCPDVAITDDDCVVTVGGRRYGLLSKSEKLRADVVCVAALARHTAPAAILVDEFELLHPTARPGAINMLIHTGVPIILGMMASNPDKLPKLNDHGMGACYWMEDGTLKETAA